MASIRKLLGKAEIVTAAGGISVTGDSAGSSGSVAIAPTPENTYLYTRYIEYLYATNLNAVTYDDEVMMWENEMLFWIT